ncbi:hypothetical protein Taro_047671 [Colocasia esculenta]|uniref:Uncharacterized protein n=1 Tax=Colocasia esculenta TaxID=4460 RepID=A0A843X1F7_COLES|nr:hypothetical protein [Colocasia esculenta]
MEEEGIGEEEEAVGKGVGEEMCFGRGFMESSGVGGAVNAGQKALGAQKLPLLKLEARLALPLTQLALLALMAQLQYLQPLMALMAMTLPLMALVALILQQMALMALKLSPLVVGYNRLIDHVRIHGQRRLTKALNKDSLVRQKEYPTESSSKSRKANVEYQEIDGSTRGIDEIVERT